MPGNFRNLFRLICASLLLQVQVAAAVTDFSITAVPSGSAVSINARATISAPYALIWSTLTDYNHLSEFIPGMHSSKVVMRRGPTAIVEQRGEAGFFIFTQGINAVVASTEYPPERIEIRIIRGNIKQLSGHYQVDRGGKEDVWVLRWIGLIEPDLSLPRFLGVPLIRSNIEDQFRGMVDEIERRENARRAAVRP